MQRRELLTGVLAVGAASLLSIRPAGATADPVVTLEGLRTRIGKVQSDYLKCRYSTVTGAVPALIRDARELVATSSPDQRCEAEALQAYSYRHAAWLALRMGDNGAAFGLADRVMEAAHASGDPLATADAAQLGAVVLRHYGQAEDAEELAIGMAQQLQVSGAGTDDEAVAAYCGLLATAAYTAASDLKRDTANDLYAEAAGAMATWRGVAATSFTQAASEAHYLPLYGVSIARALGDYGTAIERARTIQPESILVPERQARYWKDVAEAWHGWGKLEPTLQALLEVDKCAPQEAKRPWAQHLVRQLLSSTRPGTMEGLSELAVRVGVA